MDMFVEATSNLHNDEINGSVGLILSRQEVVDGRGFVAVEESSRTLRVFQVTMHCAHVVEKKPQSSHKTKREAA